MSKTPEQIATELEAMGARVFQYVGGAGAANIQTDMQALAAELRGMEEPIYRAVCDSCDGHIEHDLDSVEGTITVELCHACATAHLDEGRAEAASDYRAGLPDCTVRPFAHTCPDPPPEESRLAAPEHVAIMFCRAEGFMGEDRIRGEKTIRLEHLPREGEQSLGTLTFCDSKGRDPMELVAWTPDGGENRGCLWWKMPIAAQLIDRFVGPAQLLRRLAALGEVEQRLVDRIVERLEAGSNRYGDFKLDQDGREWVPEALEEMFDSQIYLAAALMCLDFTVRLPEQRVSNSGGHVWRPIIEPEDGDE